MPNQRIREIVNKIKNSGADYTLFDKEGTNRKCLLVRVEFSNETDLEIKVGKLADGLTSRIDQNKSHELNEIDAEKWRLATSALKSLLKDL